MRNKFLGTGVPGYNPLRKLAVIFSGLRFAIIYDLSVAYKVVLSFGVLVAAFLLRAWMDFLLIFVATGLMLIAEIFNSTIEAVCDYLQSAEDRKIGAIKDMAAASAGIAIFLWIVVLGYEVVEMILHLRHKPLLIVFP
ncbi:diacylglycerol kinase [Desulfovibrio sulfodismutans]|uniref:Diacylglycerol kinase n=1 Tax=Desulfolutivibrio sulfodismutans TaxID=63561 RepID=A0A7K3NHR1_9BACT|nr:diacylglycerol kinase [Desulfolutivibrio sulfodismutans]NDY55728.1 diacylglycerol kinase [Desulfolutivibrio sulfodismutans]QLA13747.1 diacylglycerol kinase [Desulfolutivibrio sulfodismutans DSM 3696]